MIKVMIVDDHQIMLDGLKAIFESSSDISIVKTAQSAAAAQQALDESVDVILIDIELGDDNGISLAGWVKAHFAHVKIVGFSLHQEISVISAFMKVGAHGYVNKQTDDSELGDAIRTVYKGKIYLGSNTVDSVADLMIGEHGSDSVEKLTPRELEVFRLLVLDNGTKAISETLHISQSTVETHKRNIMLKLNVNSIAGLTILAIKHGIIRI